MVAANARFGVAGTVVVGGVILAILPAPIGMLALSRSPLASINPVALTALVRVCGTQYLLVPAMLAGLVVALYLAYRLGLPRLIVDFADLYIVFLLFTLTGAIVARSDAVKLVEPVTPEEAEPERVLENWTRERVAALDHAYGLISRGNRDGGLQHIEAFIGRSTFTLEDSAWFFENMLRWEESGPALFFGQRYLTTLLNHDEEVAALKVLARCGLENPRFRPAVHDRDRLAQLVDAHNRDDLRKLVR